MIKAIVDMWNQIPAKLRKYVLRGMAITFILSWILILYAFFTDNMDILHDLSDIIRNVDHGE
tara:strand:- start:1195 stop:1380 length:186 start_codon:yes stop_codon:yes gene_type:complete